MAVLMVGIADLKTGREGDIITTLGLGSCVGVSLYDPIRKIGGMVHVMLPEFNGQMDQNPLKFANTGVNELMERLIKLGAMRASMVAKIAGGAHMFSGSGSQNILKIGQRNVVVSRETLHTLRLPIVAADTGGTYGRTIELYTDTGKLKIKTLGHGEKFI